MSRNFALEHKEKLKEELKVQLPVPIDSKRYLIGRIAFIDVAILLPFLLLSGLSIYFFFRIGWLTKTTFIISTTPTIGIGLMQFIKHSVRKEIPFLKYGVIWKYQFKKREKTFFYRKGAMDMNDKQDARRKIGIKSTFADCYETVDNRFVRVFEVSSINMALANKSEKRASLNAFKVFMTTLSFLKQIQFSQIAQPISLSRHLQSIMKKNKDEKNEIKRMLIKSYRNFMDEEIQKSRNLVTRKRYISISQNIGSDREKSLNKIDSTSQLLISKIEAMRFDYSKLTVRQLNNADLTKLMFTCVDYDSAIAIGDHIVSRAASRNMVSMGEETAKQMIESLTKELKEKIS